MDVFYFELKLLNAGKRGEVFVGMCTGDSPAIDPQLIAAIKEGKVRDGPLDKRRNGGGSEVEEEEKDEVEEEIIEIPAPSLATDRLWQHQTTTTQSPASLSQPATSAASAPYSSSAQRQLGLEHPHSFSIQLTHGRLYSMQHAKGCHVCRHSQRATRWVLGMCITRCRRRLRRLRVVVRLALLLRWLLLALLLSRYLRRH